MTASPESSVPAPDAPDAPAAPPPKDPRYALRLAALLALLACQNMAVRMMNLPLTRVVELRYCREYYLERDPGVVGPGGDVPERLCKLDGIQTRLAWLVGMLETGHVVCDLLVTLPLGVLADRGWRRVILCANLGGLALMYSWLVVVGYFDTIPTYAMLFAPLFSLFGGGDCVIQSSIASVIIEISSTEMHRSSAFAYQSSVSYIVALLSPSIAARTMTWNLWAPFWLGIGLLLAAMPLLLVLPNRPLVKAKLRERGDEAERSSLLDPVPRGGQQSMLSRAVSKFAEGLSTIKKLPIRRTNFSILLGIFSLASLASSNTPVLVQYISKRYGWTFADAGYLLSLKAAVNIICLTIIVPTTVRCLLTRSALDGTAINRAGTKLTLLLSVLGALCIALSSKMWMLIISFVIYASGSALPVFTMSLIKSRAVTDEHIGASTQDYGIVMLARTVGTLVGTPLMTAIWAAGIGIGGAGLGAPYFASVVFYTAAWILATRLKV